MCKTPNLANKTKNSSAVLAVKGYPRKYVIRKIVIQLNVAIANVSIVKFKGFLFG